MRIIFLMCLTLLAATSCEEAIDIKPASPNVEKPTLPIVPIVEPTPLFPTPLRKKPMPPYNKFLGIKIGMEESEFRDLMKSKGFEIIEVPRPVPTYTMDLEIMLIKHNEKHKKNDSKVCWSYWEAEDIEYVTLLGCMESYEGDYVWISKVHFLQGNLAFLNMEFDPQVENNFLEQIKKDFGKETKIVDDDKSIPLWEDTQRIYADLSFSSIFWKDPFYQIVSTATVFSSGYLSGTLFQFSITQKDMMSRWNYFYDNRHLYENRP